jgi:hypothetical protein
MALSAVLLLAAYLASTISEPSQRSAPAASRQHGWRRSANVEFAATFRTGNRLLVFHLAVSPAASKAFQ